MKNINYIALTLLGIYWLMMIQRYLIETSVSLNATKLAINTVRDKGYMQNEVVYNCAKYIPGFKRNITSSTEVKSKERRSYITFSDSDGRGLGNLMFNFATLIGVSHSTNRQMLVNANSALFRGFALSGVEIDYNLNRTMTEFVKVREKAAGVYEDVSGWISNLNTNVQMVGYFQSFNYFENDKKVVQEQFQFRKAIDIKSTLVINQIKKNNQKVQLNSTDVANNSSRTNRSVLTIGIHIRRGDILSKHNIKLGYASPNIEYYIKAMDIFGTIFPNKHLVFVAVSNDITGAMRNLGRLKSAYDIRFLQNRNNRFLDLSILSKCDHMIMSSGSYSWWAAWLCGGITVYYDGWPKPGSWLDKQVNKKDYFPLHWIPLK